MSTLAILDDLPAGYFVEESPGGVLALHIDSARGLHDAGFGPAQDGRLAVSDLSGRLPLAQLELGDTRLLVRRYRHGGLLRWVTGSVYFDAERPFRELIVSNALARSGIRTPQVVGARARHALGLGWRLELIVRRVERARDVAEVVEQMRRGEVAQRGRGALFQAVGKLLRDLHRVGLYHPDLTPHNLLVESDSLASGRPELWLIDLDQTYFRSVLSDADRRRNITRLLRALLRREERGSRFLRAGDFARFFRGYDPGGRHWRKDWRAIAGDLRRGRAVHRAGWILERAFGGGSDTRDGKAVVR